MSAPSPEQRTEHSLLIQDPDQWYIEIQPRYVEQLRRSQPTTFIMVAAKQRVCITTMLEDVELIFTSFGLPTYNTQWKAGPKMDCKLLAYLTDGSLIQ